MRIKVTKSGKYAVHHASGPLVDLVVGQELTDRSPYNIGFLSTMVDVYKCAVRFVPPEPPVGAMPPEPPVGAMPPDKESILKTIWGIVDLSKNKKDAKNNIAVWAWETHYIKIGRNRSLESIIEKLIEAILNAG